MEENKEETKESCGIQEDGAALGSALAQKAMSDMAGEPVRDPEEDPKSNLDDAAEAFIKECLDNDADVLDAVDKTAESFELDITGEAPKGDDSASKDKKMIYLVLRKVVAKIAMAALSHVAEYYGFDLKFLAGLISGEDNKARCRDEDVEARDAIRLRVKPMKVTMYAFKW